MTTAAFALRDRTNALPLQVMGHALDELVAGGTWTAGHGWRWLRRVATLDPAGAVPAEEPLRTADAVVRRAAAALGVPVAVRDAARYAAVHERGMVDRIVRRGIDDLIARSLLRREGTRLVVTTAGERLLAESPPPDALGPLGRAYVEAYKKVRRVPATEVSPAGDNISAIWAASGAGGLGG